MILIGYLCAIGLRLYVFIDEETIRYQGWRRTREVKWREVTGIIRGHDLPYPRDRYCGLSCYEVRTANERFIMNLLYFSPDCASAFMGEAKRRGLIRPGKRAL